MDNEYTGVNTRFLRNEERHIISEEKEMPLVIEAKSSTTLPFLQQFLTTYASKIQTDVSKYGAVLLRGFDIESEEDFENSVLAIKGLNGISEAFMSEEGRIHVGNLKYVLHTNAVYKTGGTVYLGGFHGENYYSTDVPSYISFCCFKPSTIGGETGLINTTKIYPHLDQSLIEKLEAHSFFVSKWLISEVADRYKLSTETIEKICHHFDLPLKGEGSQKFVLMYKPSLFEHPETKQKALQINFFEIASLNVALRKHFMDDYQGKTWFWHRFFWKTPSFILKPIELFYMACASFFYSPKNALSILKTKYAVYRAAKKIQGTYDDTKVGSCFSPHDVENLAQLMRRYYCSCLWQKGDILLVDNRQVVHAGMPGEGPRVVRAMICNPIEMSYAPSKPGKIDCKPQVGGAVGSYMSNSGSCPENAQEETTYTHRQ